jgi:hypothetical protein
MEVMALNTDEHTAKLQLEYHDTHRCAGSSAMSAPEATPKALPKVVHPALET